MGLVFGIQISRYRLQYGELKVLPVLKGVFKGVPIFKLKANIKIWLRPPLSMAGGIGLVKMIVVPQLL